MADSALIPAAELAAKNTLRFPNESAAYRKARQALLIEEIELRPGQPDDAPRRRAFGRGLD